MSQVRAWRRTRRAPRCRSLGVITPRLHRGPGAEGSGQGRWACPGGRRFTQIWGRAVSCLVHLARWLVRTIHVRGVRAHAALCPCARGFRGLTPILQTGPPPNRLPPGPPKRVMALLRIPAISERIVLPASCTLPCSLGTFWPRPRWQANPHLGHGSLRAQRGSARRRAKWGGVGRQSGCGKHAAWVRVWCTREREGGALDMTERRMDSIVWMGNQRSLASS